MSRQPKKNSKIRYCLGSARGSKENVADKMSCTKNLDEILDNIVLDELSLTIRLTPILN